MPIALLPCGDAKRECWYGAELRANPRAEKEWYLQDFAFKVKVLGHERVFAVGADDDVGGQIVVTVGDKVRLALRAYENLPQTCLRLSPETRDNSNVCLVGARACLEACVAADNGDDGMLTYAWSRRS
jgi:hypothetical protein